MDIYAYMQIENLDDVAKANGIENVPRLRGYRLMINEKPIPEENIKAEIGKELESQWRDLERTVANMLEDALAQNFDSYECDKSWLSMHEHMIRNYADDLREEYEMFNKYAGRADVLMIHSRMGGKKISHWDDKTHEHIVDYDLEAQPWFLDHVRDAFDSTYCDIYAKIDPATVPEKLILHDEEE